MTLARERYGRASRASADASWPLVEVPGIESLEPISLGEVVERAGLLTRVDRKYVLDVAEAGAVLDAVGAGARVLEIDGRRAQAYRSTYYDTEGLELYHAAAHRRRRRSKVRMRHYLDTSADFFEVKTRGARGVTVKERVPVVGESGRLDVDRLPVELLGFVADRLSPTVLDEERVGDLHPVLDSSYTRTTLLTADGVSRVTIDTDLAWTTPDGARVAPRRLCIVETKSPPGSARIDRRLWRRGLRPARMSKFATGLAALRPDLPSNHWHRVLDRAFHHAPDASAGHVQEMIR